MIKDYAPLWFAIIRKSSRAEEDRRLWHFHENFSPRESEVQEIDTLIRRNVWFAQPASLPLSIK